MKRMVSFIIVFMVLLNMTACSFLSGNEDGLEEPSIPHLENYLNIEPTDEMLCDVYHYETADATPIYMGGHAYHGGFTLYDDGGEGDAFVTFDISEYSGKILSFLMGSNQQNGFQEDGVWLVSVTLDGEQVIEARIQADSLPEHYTLDLTGKKELKFSIVRCENAEARLAVAEMTVWDSAAEVMSGLYVAEAGTQAQLIKDIFPYLYTNGSSESVQIYTEREAPEYVSDFNASTLIQGTSVSVGGKSHTDAFSQYCYMPVTGTMKRGCYFNVEGFYNHLTFSVGGKDSNENAKSGTSWLTVYADGKSVHEELVESDALPKTYTVDITGCKVLKFEFQYESGADHYLTVFDAVVAKTESDLPSSGGTSAADLPDVCKLVSNIAPYTVASNLPKSVFDGSSQYETFTLVGRKYNEGIVLYANVGFLSGNSGAHTCFNLEGAFKNLTFTVGLLDKTPQIADETLNIYLDGELAESIPLRAMELPQKHTVALNNCNELKLELSGASENARPAYGLAEMVVYKGDVTENNLFPADETEYPDKMSLIENIKPYMTYVSYADEGEFQTVFDGSTKKEYFEIDGEKIYSGLILCTSVHLDLTGLGNDGTVFGNLMFNALANDFMMMLASGVVHENSFSAFDLHGEFSKVKFTVACKETAVGKEAETKLLIGTDGKAAETILLTPDMEPTTYTVDIANAEQLLFFLQCGESGSAYYAIYDIVVEK